MTADLILRNLHAVTFSKQSEPVELIAVQGNRITYVGTADAIESQKGPRTQELDCCGGLVVPGFNDAHCHVYAFAATKSYADCSTAHSIADIQAVLQKKATEIEGGQWVRAANCDFSLLAEGRFPNRQDLDTAVLSSPVLLMDRSGQHCALNSIALELCGITKNTPASASGAELENGVISVNNERATKAIPALTEQDFEQGMRQANREFLSMGITSVQDTSWSNTHRHWLAMKKFKDSGIMLPRLTLLAGVDALEEFEEQGMKTGSGDVHMRLGAVKIALDEGTGDPFPPQDTLNSLALKAHLAGFQLAFHVADIYLLKASLQALHFIRETTSNPSVRPRFEHCPICPPALLPVLAKCGAIVVTQPNLFYETGPRFPHFLSSDDLQSVYPWASFVQHGIPLALSSDSPLTPCNPFPAMLTSVTRKVAGGATLLPQERLSAMQALKAYSYGGAYASRDEQTKGAIAVGMLADMVVLNCDPLCMSQDALGDASVMATVLDGKVVWEG